MKKLLLAATALVAVSVLGGWPIGSAQAAVKVQTVDYKQGDSTLEGWLVYDDAKQGKRPGVVVFPAWNGPDEDAKGRAQMLAKLGYVAFVADVYGKGVRPADNKGAMAEASKYMKDRALLRDRAKAAFDALRKNAMVNPSKIAAIGYCFGGAGALDLARSGAPIVDTVAFHGDIASPTPQDDNNIKGRVLVLHGAADPIVGQKRPGRVPQGNDRCACELGNGPLRRRGPLLHAERRRQRPVERRRLQRLCRQAILGGDDAAVSRNAVTPHLETGAARGLEQRAACFIRRRSISPRAASAAPVCGRRRLRRDGGAARAAAPIGRTRYRASPPAPRARASPR